ncbi:twin-arginine translocation signal domain-containing protein [Neptunomonas concharum]|uniref:Twin-arginine translocation signal domain-containing protein n=1 Tax=Neptunomonas concharum TaxID=1031538 RepID=A0A5P1RF80_9GAMM|nr:twin-arginine translocation signal domain-containing protein [Neptunomonas concharum]QEQ97921.1 twin-arginine translocation signal domain-containing protein [Neptunomonas concharum]
MSRQKQTDIERRDFLKTLGMAGVATAGAALAGQAQAASAEVPENEATQSSGYQETPHVRSYYDTLRK